GPHTCLRLGLLPGGKGRGVSRGPEGVAARRAVEAADNAADGASVERGGELTATRARLRAHRPHGLHLLPAARATLTSCRLTGNTEDGLRSESAESVRLTDCLAAENE
ncbi:hypothetical protein VM98_37540, partial [Streptomyces rubellomurinus subsp. indigoferus]